MPEPDLPVLDERVLNELLASTGDDLTFVRELVETFLAEAPGQMEAMEAAVGADDADALVRPAHTLKSSAATVGATRLSSVARELEMAGRSGTLESTSNATLEAAQTEWRAASSAFAAWLTKGGNQ